MIIEIINFNLQCLPFETYKCVGVIFSIRKLKNNRMSTQVYRYSYRFDTDSTAIRLISFSKTHKGKIYKICC